MQEEVHVGGKLLTVSGLTSGSSECTSAGGGFEKMVASDLPAWRTPREGSFSRAAFILALTVEKKASLRTTCRFKGEIKRDHNHAAH